MSLNDQILETIQQIGGIFLIKGIPSVPVNMDYLDVKIAQNMEKIVLSELIMYLEELFVDYLTKHKKVHKLSKYVKHFKDTLENNIDGENLVNHKKKTA